MLNLILKPLDEGALYDPVAPDFTGFARWNQPYDTDGNRSLCISLVLIMRPTQLDVGWLTLQLLSTFILNRFDKMRSQDDEKNELVRDYP